FAVLLLYLFLLAIPATQGFAGLPQFLVIVLGLWLLFRLAQQGIRKAIWALRNRLLVTYAFIAVVPVLLILVLVVLGAYALLGQLAVYFENSELERRIASLRGITEALASAEPKDRPELLQHLERVYRKRFPGLVILCRNGSSVLASRQGKTVE